MSLIEQIKSYILFLKKDMGLQITLHPSGVEGVIMPTELSVFNIHDNSYCIFAKSCNELYDHCIECQKKVRQRVKQGSFIGTCHAGVKELIYPITDGTERGGFISVSGYKSENAPSYLKRLSQKYALPYRQLQEVYDSLQDEMPPKDRVDTLISPLIRMLELAYLQKESLPTPTLSFADEVAIYINRHHCRDITSEDICRRFNCSRSYMSGCFNRDMGMSVREYITRLRIEDAKQLLIHSKISITEIALTVGYTDSNYFTNLFKNKVGVTPGEYRKKAKRPG